MTHLLKTLDHVRRRVDMYLKFTLRVRCEKYNSVSCSGKEKSVKCEVRRKLSKFDTDGSSRLVRYMRWKADRKGVSQAAETHAKSLVWATWLIYNVCLLVTIGG